jgi:hypothetical protein
MICSYFRCVIVIISLHTVQLKERRRGPEILGNSRAGYGPGPATFGCRGSLCCATLSFTLYYHSGWASPLFIETVQDILTEEAAVIDWERIGTR